MPTRIDDITLLILGLSRRNLPVAVTVSFDGSVIFHRIQKPDIRLLYGALLIF